MVGLILIYLAAIVVANLIVSYYGPGATIPVAFVLIGLDLTVRDRLHDEWKYENLWPRMAVLIATGSVLSYILNKDSGQIALASFVAFAVAASADTITYHLLGHRVHLIRINGSNVVSAALDSLLFPTIAFGVLLWPVIIGQFLAKVVGGFVWSILLNEYKTARRQHQE